MDVKTSNLQGCLQGKEKIISKAMQGQKISSSAYLLRRQWEQEDKKLFRKFKKQEGVMGVINALAEVITQAEVGVNRQIQSAI